MGFYFPFSIGLNRLNKLIKNLSTNRGGYKMALKPKQINCIEVMLANPTMSNEKLAEIVGVNRNTISDWKRYNKEFKEEYQKRLKEIWEDSESIAVKTMRNLAEQGNFQASKYILDSLGYAPAQKVEASVSTDININIEE